MQHPHLPITALPAWSKLNDVKFLDIEVQDLKTKGFGLITCRALSSEDASDVTTLMTVPRDLVLSSEAVDEYAKVDAHLRELLDAAGGKVCFSYKIHLFYVHLISKLYLTNV